MARTLPLLDDIFLRSTPRAKALLPLSKPATYTLKLLRFVV